MIEPDEDWADFLEKKVKDFFRLTVATHQRRCCIKHNVRSHSDIKCNCVTHWDLIRQWCKNCGRTKMELIEEKGWPAHDD